MTVDRIPFEPPARPSLVPAPPPPSAVPGVELTIDGGSTCYQPLPELDFEGMQEDS